MNQRLMQSNPFTRFGMMAVVLSFAAAACVAQRSALSDAQVASSSKPTDAEVLLYTDNTAGSIFWAKTWQKVIRRSGMAVEVVTDEETFIEALPEKSWKEVVVVARYKRGEPSYAAALRRYMRTDEVEGELSNEQMLSQYTRDIRVRFYYWYDNPESPATDVPGTMLVAPTLMQNWTALGRTSFSYIAAGPKTPKSSAVTGYAFAARSRVSSGFLARRYKSSVIKTLQPGIYASEMAGENSPLAGSDDVNTNGGGGDGGGGECFAPFDQDLTDCSVDSNARQVNCATRYGTGGTENGVNLYKCMLTSDSLLESCNRTAFGTFVFCLGIELKKEVQEILGIGE